MYKYLLSLLVGKKSAEIASISGKSLDNNNIIVQKRSYWKYSLILPIFIIGILLVYFFSEYDDSTSTKDLILFFSFIGLSVIISVVVLLFLILYKIKIYDDYFEIRKFFRYKRYSYSSVYLKFAGSYRFVYYNKKYITRIPILLDNWDSLGKKYYEYFTNKNLKIPKGPDGYIKQSKAVLFVAICITLIFAIILLIIFFESKTVFYYSLPSIALVVPLYSYYFVWKITYDDETMTYRNLFGFKKNYELKQLGWKQGNNGRTIYYNDKKVCSYFEITDSDNLDVKIKDLNRSNKMRKKANKSK